jgi:glycosyltransferase involved in cell wall biosynthesis
MALGLPVLGTTNAFEGIQMVNARHGAVYTNNDDCRDWLLRLLGNSDLRKMLGEFAARFAAEKYSIEIVGPQYEQLYREALEHGAIQRET